MDEIKLSLDRLSELSDGEIADLEGQILSAFDKIEKEDPTRETVDSMTGLADALEAVRGETTRRTDEQAELARRATEATTRVRGEQATAADDVEEAGLEDPDPEKGTSDAADSPQPEDTPEVSEQIEGDGTEEDPAKKKVPALFSESTDKSTELATEAPASAETPVAAPTEASVEEPTGAALAAADDAAPTTSTAEELSTDESAEKSEGAVTASAQSGGPVVVTPPAGNRPVPREDRTGLQLAITAGADIPGIGSGAHLSNMDDVASAFAKKLHTLRNVSGGMGEQHTVATLQFEYPEDRQLAGDDSTNFGRIDKVNSRQAITAAAAVCAPLETLYDIEVCGVTDRPVRDSLARFNADRGGVRIYGAPALGNCVGLWNTTGSWSGAGKLSIATAANASGTAPYTGFPATPNATATAKGCCDSVCPDPRDVILDAIYACMRFSNFTTRFFPEVVKANTDLALINHARFAEQYLLNGIHGQSTKVTLALNPGVGLARAMVKAVRQAVVGIRRRNRLDANAPMRTILPVWLLDAMVADIAMQMPGDGLESLGVAESKLRAIWSDANVNVTWALDEVDAAGEPVALTAQGAGALNGFPTTVSFPVFPEGSFLYLDGGTMDLGIVRDTSTIAANEYATFVESFENVAFTGCESLWVSATGLCVSRCGGGSGRHRLRVSLTP